MKLRTVALILTFALGLLAAPLPAEAQQKGKVYRIGWLAMSSRAAGGVLREAFLQELHDLGWIAGQNVIIEYRFAGGRREQLPNLASELVRVNPDVILTASIPAIRSVYWTLVLVLKAISRRPDAKRARSRCRSPSRTRES